MDTKDTAVAKERAEGISLLDFAIIFAKQKRTIVFTMLLFIALGFADILVCPRRLVYKSNLQMMVILPNVVSEDTLALSVSSSLVRAIVNSNAAKDAVIDRFYSKELRKAKANGQKGFRETMYKRLDKNIKIEKDDETLLITLSVCAKTPQKAHDMVTYIYEFTNNKLEELTNSSIQAVDDLNTANIETELKNRMSQASKTSMLNLYDLLVSKDQIARLRGRLPVSLQIISPASVTDRPEPRGRLKTLMMFAIIGFALGFVVVFAKYVWSTVDEAKKQEFKAAMKLR